MADLSAFNNDGFNVIEWMNNALKEKAEEENLESYLASLSMKLHIISQDYTDQLETGMIEAIATMPRISSEISRLEEILQSIDGEMNDLTKQLQALDQKNVAGIEDLSRLDMLKTNMENCKATLEEHARWSAVVREARTFLEGGGRLSDSADRIEIMYKSLDILKNISGHEEREQTYNELRDTLLTAMRPQVLRDVEGSDLAQLQEYLYVYAKLGKSAELEDEYTKARPKALLLQWNSYSAAQIPLSSWLADFSDSVINFLSNESVNITTIFVNREKTSIMLSSLLVYTLTAVSKSLASRLQALHSSQLSYETFLVTDSFASRVLSFIDINNTGRLSEVLSAVYGSYLTYGDQYVDDEGQFLKSQLNTVIRKISFDQAASQLSDLGDLGEQDPHDVFVFMSEALVVASEDCITPIAECLRRAVTFIGGLKSKAVFRSAASAISAFIKSLCGRVDELRIACGVPPDNYNSSEKIGTDESSALKAESWAKKLESYDLGTKPLLQCALRSLQATGRMIKRSRDLENIAVGYLANLLATLYKDQSLEKAITAALTSSGSVCAQYAGSILQQDFAASSELRSFLTASTSLKTTHTIFGSVSSPLNRLKLSSGSLLFDLCSSVPEKVLSSLHSEDVWNSDLVGGVDNLLPQSCFTQVGEHLLSIVQEMEFFASSDALSDLLNLIGEAGNLVPLSRGWKQLKTLLDITEEESLQSISKRSSCAGMIITVERSIYGSVFTRIDDSENPLPAFTVVDGVIQKGDEESASWAFVNEWLGAMADAVAGLILVQILKIPLFSKYGQSQLIVDIDYITNVLQAMGLKQHPLLIHVHHVISQSMVTISESVDSVPPPSAGRGTATGALHKLDHILLKAINNGGGK